MKAQCCVCAKILFILCCILILGQSAASAQIEQPVVNVGLADVDEVYVRIISDKVTDVDIQGLEDAIGKKLEGDGLKVASGDISEMDEREKERVTGLMERQGRSAGNLRFYSSKIPELIVRISVLQGEAAGPCVYHVQTSFAREMYLRRARASMKAEVWRIDVPIGIADANECESAIREAALGQADAFAADWKKASTAKRSSRGEAHSTDLTKPDDSEPDEHQEQKTTSEYVASKNSKVFHKSDCRTAARISSDNLIGFSSREEAVNSGRRPCKICNP